MMQPPLYGVAGCEYGGWQVENLLHVEQVFNLLTFRNNCASRLSVELVPSVNTLCPPAMMSKR